MFRKLCHLKIKYIYEAIYKISILKFLKRFEALVSALELQARPNRIYFKNIYLKIFCIL